MSGIVDAHLHLWDRSGGGYAWIRPELGALDDDFRIEQALAELDAAGIERAVLVQADDTIADTERMLAVAHGEPRIAGVVGWIPLDDESAAAAALEARAAERALVGIRHLVHDDPRDEFLELPAVRASLARVAAAGLAFDVPDAWPRFLGATRRLAAALPELTVVVDHLGKPPAGRPDYGQWRAELRRVAAQPNTVAKFSGLHLPGVPFGVASLRPLWEEALDAFGPERLMYGGDWPMSVPHGGYAPTWAAMSSLIDALAPAERDAVLGGTATRVYRLAESSDQSPDATGEAPAISRQSVGNIG